MANFDREKMTAISDKVIKDYLEKNNHLPDNDYTKGLLTTISDISAMIVLEYHKEINNKN